MSDFKSAPSTPIDDAAQAMLAVTDASGTPGWLYLVIAIAGFGVLAYLGLRLYDALDI